MNENIMASLQDISANNTHFANKQVKELLLTLEESTRQGLHRKIRDEEFLARIENDVF